MFCHTLNTRDQVSARIATVKVKLVLHMGVDFLQRATATHSARAKVNHQIMGIQNHFPTAKVRVQVNRQVREKVILPTVAHISLQAIRLKSFIHNILKT
jgi:hypothetical protein